jgi:hypothetical protein
MSASDVLIALQGAGRAHKRGPEMIEGQRTTRNEEDEMPGIIPRHRTFRITMALLALMLVFAIVPIAPPVQAHTVFEAPIYSTAGGIMGTATLTPLAGAEWEVVVRVSGFQPIGGDRRLAIRNVGRCTLPTFSCTGDEIIHLPNIQFFPDGSASYRTVTTAITEAKLRGSHGSSIVIHADVNIGSPIIGCGEIVPTGAAPAPTATKSPTAAPPAFGSPTHVVAPLGLKMRSAANLAASVILTLSNGETVFPSNRTAVSQGITWVFVRVHRGGRAHDGWVASNYLAAFATQPPPATGARARVTASDGLRLRAGAGTGFAIRRIVPHGTVLTLTGAEQWGNGILWAQVRFDGVTLWAAKQYLQPI